VFGQVVEGMNVVNEIQMAETDDNDGPLYEYRILRAYVLRDER
jgi:cyclophilin family peptidyl-prolyl cis-trans isomerase